MKNKLIITLAPTGNVPTREMTPFAATTNETIIRDLKECEALGVSIAHLHVRDDQEKPVSDRNRFKLLSELMDKEGINLIKQFSTGARGGGMNDPEYRGQMLDLKPLMASLSTGSSNFPDSINGNSPEVIRELALKMKKYNIKPEIEVFDYSMISSAVHLLKKGILEGPLHFNFVMNVPGSIKGTPKNLMILADAIPEGSTFNVCGIGKAQIQMLTLSILLGGHVRTGLEDVIKLDDKLVSNADLIKRVVSIAKVYGREIATVEEAKEILSLRK